MLTFEQRLNLCGAADERLNPALATQVFLAASTSIGACVILDRRRETTFGARPVATEEAATKLREAADPAEESASLGDGIGSHLQHHRASHV
jgi:hypothetical protein